MADRQRDVARSLRHVHGRLPVSRRDRRRMAAARATLRARRHDFELGLGGLNEQARDGRLMDMLGGLLASVVNESTRPPSSIHVHLPRRQLPQRRPLRCGATRARAARRPRRSTRSTRAGPWINLEPGEARRAPDVPGRS